MNRLYRECALHRRERAQARVSALELLHDEAVRRVAHAGAAVLLQIRSVEAQRTQLRREMFGEFARTMTRNDLRQDFFLHKIPRSITRRALFVREKVFDAVII